MHFIRKLVLIASSLCLATSACFADTLRCERTVTNTSEKTWTIKYNTTYGHVEMKGAHCTSGNCVLAPNESVMASYYYDNGSIRRGPASGGAITIIDYQGNVGVMHYYSDDVGQPDLCPEIMNYTGKTGVALNQPRNGAIQMNYNSWQ